MMMMMMMMMMPLMKAGQPTHVGHVKVLSDV
jgi:hypothetical protein